MATGGGSSASSGIGAVVKADELEVPPESDAQFAALMELSLTNLRPMLKQASLPLQGDKRSLVVRLIRHLAGWDPCAADEELFKAAERLAAKAAERAATKKPKKAPTPKKAKKPSMFGSLDDIKESPAKVDEENTLTDIVREDPPTEAAQDTSTCVGPLEAGKQESQDEACKEDHKDNAIVESTKRNGSPSKPSSPSSCKNAIGLVEDAPLLDVVSQISAGVDVVSASTLREAKSGQEQLAVSIADEVMPDKVEPLTVVVVPLPMGLAESLLAEEGRWQKHFEIVCASACLEVSYDTAVTPKVVKKVSAEDFALQQAEEKAKFELAEILDQLNLVVQVIAEKEKAVQNLEKSLSLSKKADVDSKTKDRVIKSISETKSQLKEKRVLEANLTAELNTAKRKHEENISQARKTAARAGKRNEQRQKSTTKRVMRELPKASAWRLATPSEHAEELLLNPGVHVSVFNLQGARRRLNGCAGRIISRKGAFWLVRLADGCEMELDTDNLFPRDVMYGEAWIRPSNTQGQHFDSQHVERVFHLLCYTLLCKSLPALGTYSLSSLGDVTVLEVPPPAARRLRCIDMLTIMSDCTVVGACSDRPDESGSVDGRNAPIVEGQVVEALKLDEPDGQAWLDAEVLHVEVAGVHVRWCRGRSEEIIPATRLRSQAQRTGAQLIIFGDENSRSMATLHVAACIERIAPGSFKQAGDEKLAECWKGMDLVLTRPKLTAAMLGQGDSNWETPEMLALRMKRVATRTGVLLEKIGARIGVMGTSRQRRDGKLLLDVLGQATNDVIINDPPRELMAFCTRVRIPQAAANRVLALTQTMENYTDMFCLWQEPAQLASSASVSEADVMKKGTRVLAYSTKRGKTWQPAIIVQPGRPGKPRSIVVVRWEADGKKMRIPGLKTRLTSSEERARRERHRCELLDNSWKLFIFGSPRQRREAAMRAMSCSEEICPGLWTSELLDAMDELRAEVEASSDTVDVEVHEVPRELEPTEPGLHGATSIRNRWSLRRAMAATNCYVQACGTSALLLLGTRQERTYALEYIKWLLPEYRQRSASETIDESASRTDLHSVWEARAKRDDVVRITTTRGQSVWLEPSKLRQVERDTKTILLVDHGSTDEKWIPSAPAFVHVCGLDPELRATAAKRVEEMISSIPVEKDDEVKSTTATEGLTNKESKEISSHKDKTQKDAKEWEGRLMGAAASLLEPSLQDRPSDATSQVATHTESQEEVPQGSSGADTLLTEPVEPVLQDESSGAITQAVAHAEAQDVPEGERPHKKHKKSKDKDKGQHVTEEGDRSHKKKKKSKENDGGQEEIGEEEHPRHKKQKKSKDWDGGQVMGAVAPLLDPESRDKSIDATPPVVRGPATSHEDSHHKHQTIICREEVVAEETQPPVDTRQALRELGYWPTETSQWKDLQEIVFAGHQKLGAGWIRVWSRSKDSEYYYRLKDGKTSFSLNEALVSGI